MKKLNIGQSISVFANLGVVAGIVFLAIEISQNNELLRMQADISLTSNRATGAYLIAQDNSIAAAIAKIRNGEALSQVEGLKLDSLASGVLSNWESEFRQQRSGLLEYDLDRLGRGWAAAARNFPHIEEAWKRVHDFRDPEFARFMDDVVLAQ